MNDCVTAVRACSSDTSVRSVTPGVLDRWLQGDRRPRNGLACHRSQMSGAIGSGLYTHTSRCARSVRGGRRAPGGVWPCVPAHSGAFESRWCERAPRTRRLTECDPRDPSRWQFCDQVLPIAFGEFNTPEVVHQRGFLDVVVDLGEPTTVRISCCIVDEWQSAADSLVRVPLPCSQPDRDRRWRARRCRSCRTGRRRVRGSRCRRRAWFVGSAVRGTGRSTRFDGRCSRSAWTHARSSRGAATPRLVPARHVRR